MKIIGSLPQDSINLLVKVTDMFKNVCMCVCVFVCVYKCDFQATCSMYNSAR